MDKKQQPKAVRRKSGQGGGRIFRSIVIVFLALVLVGGVSVFFMLSTIVGSVDTDDMADKIVNREPSTFYASAGKMSPTSKFPSLRSMPFWQSRIPVTFPITDSTFPASFPVLYSM